MPRLRVLHVRPLAPEKRPRVAVSQAGWDVGKCLAASRPRAESTSHPSAASLARNLRRRPDIGYRPSRTIPRRTVVPSVPALGAGGNAHTVGAAVFVRLPDRRSGHGVGAERGRGDGNGMLTWSGRDSTPRERAVL